MITPTLQDELQHAGELATRAGAIVLSYRGQVKVEHKDGGEPVTRADREASDFIMTGLARTFPHDVLISEEGADDLRRLGLEKRVWFVDPLDGTKDFIAGRSGFAVMIGLVIEGRPQLGVVYQPIGNNLFLAANGLGASWVTDDGQRPLHCSSVAQVQDLRLVASYSHRTDDIDKVKKALDISDEWNVGSVGIKLALIALGERELYVNPGSRSKAWDTCAPEALLHEAGGRLSDLFGAPLIYDQPDLHNRRGLLATNGLLHEAVLARLRPLFPGP